ncbi:MAG TPA: hypothetical protein GX503_03455 [Clostridiales bacterium]|nr:hypothetical protein [Clostridiales bacterium]
MLKFAFIFEAGSPVGDNHQTVYENAESYNLLKGIDSVDNAEAVVKKLVDEEGYELLNFCGAFTEEMLDSYRKAVNKDVRMAVVKYLPEEDAKFEKLSAVEEYGIIVVMRGVTEMTKVELKGGSLNAYAYFVKDLDMAKEAAKKLVADGIHFIELCSWFDREKTDAIIQAIDGKVPVGTAGTL